MHIASKGLIVSALLAFAGCGPVDPCAEGGTGTFNFTLTNPGHVLLTAPDGTTRDVTASGQLTGQPSGRWQVRLPTYTLPDPRVRRVMNGGADGEVCLGAGMTRDLEMNWQENVASNKLWSLNANGAGPLLAFPASELGTSGTADAVMRGEGPWGSDLAFDPFGNLWSHGGTTADSMLVRTASVYLRGTEPKLADHHLDLEGVDCLPSVAGLAFDPAGNLWVSSPCMKKVYRVAADELNANATITAAVELSGFDSPAGLAFDADGALYVADPQVNRIFRFAPGATTPSNSIDLGLLEPSWFAFDRDGDLWVDDFGGNTVFELKKADLGAATATPAVTVTLPVGALLEGMAFDEGMGLWVSYSAGKIARLSPAQLTVSTGAGDPTVPETVLTSSDIGNASNVAVYPAPAGLPLRHSLP